MNRIASFRNVFLLLILASIWSSSFAVIKVGVETLPPMTLATLRILLAALILYAYVRMKGLSAIMPRKMWGLAFIVGLFGNGLPFTLIGWGEQTIDSGLAAILMAVMPLTTLLLLHWTSSDERLTPIKLTGITTGFLGVVVLVGPEALKGLGGDAIRQIVVAGGAVCYAIATSTAKHMPPMHPAQRGAAVMIMAGLQMIPVSLLIDRPWELSPSMDSILAAVYLGIFPTALATLIYFALMSARGATFISLNNYLIPGLGVIWGWLFLDESISVQSLGALALILTGIAITNMKRQIT